MSKKSPEYPGFFLGDVQVLVRLHRQPPVAGNTGFNTQARGILFLADRLQRDDPLLFIRQRGEQFIQRFDITHAANRVFDLISTLQRLRENIVAAAHVNFRRNRHPGGVRTAHFMRAAGFNLTAVAVLFEQLGQRRQVVDAGFTPGNHHVARRPALTANDRQQIFCTSRAPLIALFGFSQNAKQRHFPICEFIPRMFGITPGTANRASL
ncbi:hypothetical protein EcWSU1_03581 [Enterobacter ludwigii]|uniref:Uncharacterized protein n=1 Tax=Enterobacter ludwigii TaxID=299767 RepID=G8LCJ2_9ENTR|nr:hypothetical protein EcWSU1_03581 [Enterobacter ludwigii]